MSGAQPMGSVRRRIPGMTSQPGGPGRPGGVEPEPEPESPAIIADAPEALIVSTSAPMTEKPAKAAKPRSARAGEKTSSAGVPERRPPVDYASTRLVNFRIPVDLHDRFRALVHEAEVSHPRLRRPSFTELVIALLAEGPETADEVAELIRRKRAAEHGAEV